MLLKQTFDFTSIPPTWALCFNERCPHGETCMRYFVGRHLPADTTAGQKDYAARMMQIERQREEYYKSLGTPLGVPTMKGATADPDNTGVGYNTIITNLGDHSVPEGWIQHPKRNTTPGTPPGPPIQWGAPEDPENAQPGYGYIPAGTTDTEDIFYYHSDHLGSTSYITDAKANITQFDAYLPYGELLVDEHSSSEEMPYKFNGKELDQETGLYYYGARYMNPRTSMWYGVDALTEKYQFIGSYVYCSNNPIKIVDVDGNDELHVNGEGKIIKVVNNNSSNITIVDPNGSKKYFSDYTISSYFFGWGNGDNRQIIANVTGYYARKAGVLGLVGTVGSKIGQALAYYSHNDGGIWVAPGENGKPNYLLSNKYNLMNSLKHENYHKEDHDKGLYFNHYLHASVVERASKDLTFSKTSLEYKKGQAGYFSQLAMVAYYQPDGNSKNDVLKLINKFNSTNKGGIHLDFEKDSKRMIVTINEIKYYIKYIPSSNKGNL